MPLKAVIFDFDGVIADSEPLHFKAILEVAKRTFGIKKESSFLIFSFGPTFQESFPLG